MHRGMMIGAGVLLAMSVSGVAAFAAEEEHHAKLPAGPIRDRHELMEGIGGHAKKIGQALKAGNVKAVAPEADAIAAAAKKITALFPPGSTHKDSRAKPEIWTDWKTFESDAARLQKDAGDLAQAARTNGDVDAASKQMFGGCKSCHDSFRIPKEGE